MIRISIDEEDSGHIDRLVSSLSQAGYVTQSNGMTLDVLSVRQEREKKSDKWRLNAVCYELAAPTGSTVKLTHSECCILRTVAQANGNLVSRKTLIAALGQNYIQYDERRLEALISRLRRKLAPYEPGGFPVRAIRGQGYLFEAQVQEICTSNAA